MKKVNIKVKYNLSYVDKHNIIESNFNIDKSNDFFI